MNTRGFAWIAVASASFLLDLAQMPMVAQQVQDARDAGFEKMVREVIRSSAIPDFNYEPRYWEQLAQVKAKAESAFPIAEAVLTETSDPQIAGAALRLIAGLNIEKARRRKIVSGVLTGTIPVPEEHGIVASEILGNLKFWAEPDDVGWVLSGLNFPGEFAAHKTVSAISEFGDRSSAELLMRALQKREERMSPEERADDDLLEYGQQQVAEMLKRLEAAEARPPDEAGSGVGKPGDVPHPPSAQDTPKSSATPTSVETADEDDRSHAAIWWLAGGLAALGTVGWLFVRFRR